MNVLYVYNVHDNFHLGIYFISLKILCDYIYVVIFAVLNI